MEDPKHICDVEDEKCVLEVWECGCGFHLGLDASYLDQVGDLEVPCPNCGYLVKTAHNIRVTTYERGMKWQYEGE